MQQSFANNEKNNLKLQILEIIPNDIYTKIRLSDSEFWLEVRLHKKFENYIKTGLVKKYDIVNKVSFSGSNDEQNITLENFCRPKSIQLSTPRRLGMPVPLFHHNQITARTLNRHAKTGAPRILDLFNDEPCQPTSGVGQKRKLSQTDHERYVHGDILASSDDLQGRVDPSLLHEDYYHVGAERCYLNKRDDPFNPDGFEDFDQLLERFDL